MRPLLHHRSSTKARARTVALERDRHPTPAGSARRGPIRRSLWPGPSLSGKPPAVPRLRVGFPRAHDIRLLAPGQTGFSVGISGGSSSWPSGCDRYTRLNVRAGRRSRSSRANGQRRWPCRHCSGGERSSQSTTRRRHVGRASKVSKARISARSCLDIAASMSPRE